MEIIDTRDKAEYMMKQEARILQESRQNRMSPPPPTTASPPSASSSPTHEFSFTVAIHPHPPLTSPQHPDCNTYENSFSNHKSDTNTTTSLQPPAAIDLSPADDIFFQGHLLPLHRLSHLPDSPRSSTHSMDSFTLPMNLLFDFDPNNSIGNTSFHCHHQTTFSDLDEPEVTISNQNRLKSKSFSLFGIPKWKKRFDDERETEEDQNTERNNCKKLKLDLGQLIKRYMKMVRPLLSFPKSRRSNTKFNHQSYSFSGNSLSSKPPAALNRGGKRRGQFSAPASMRTSPANSGILLASGAVSPTKSTTSESTMEELHAAIQAAIAHCKNSIAVEDKIHESEN